MRVANVEGKLVLIRGSQALDVETASQGRFGPAVQPVFDRWAEFKTWAEGVVSEDWKPFDERLIGPPVTNPRQVFAIALNYREHAAEANEASPTFPPTFTKFPTSITGPYDTVELPTNTVDWEVELVVVISAEADHVAASSAWDYVAGFTIGQDLSERTMQNRPPVPQFSLAKSFPGFSPLGPVLVTVDEFTDPSDLAIECSVDGEVLQRSRTSAMIFRVPELIESLSAICPLLPGDIIFTGTPSGVGVARKPQQFLKPGQTLVTSIEGIGELRNPMVASAHFVEYGEN